VSERRLQSIIPGITKNTVTLPSRAPVSKRDVCVFSHNPMNVRLKSMARGRAARIKKLNGGVAVFLSERNRG
jgi:hypothetical protein